MPSIYPLQEILIICQGCGGERRVSDEHVAKILSAEDLKRFTSHDLAKYACRCGAKKCDLRILPAEESMEDLRKQAEAEKPR